MTSSGNIDTRSPKKGAKREDNKFSFKTNSSDLHCEKLYSSSNSSSNSDKRPSNNLEFYKIPKPQDFGVIEINASSEEALVEKCDQIWEEIQEVKCAKTVLESRLMNMTEDDKIMEKVLILVDKGSVTNPTKSKYQV